MIQGLNRLTPNIQNSYYLESSERILNTREISYKLSVIVGYPKTIYNENANNLNITNTNNDTDSDNDNSDIPSIFSAFKDTDETFSTYCIYIIREGDSLDTVINKYKTTRDILAEYNDLSDIRIGTKIIIPSTNE